VVNKESPLWLKYGSEMGELEAECNINSLKECCEESFTLENYKGHVGWAVQGLEPKQWNKV
jgi:hypothetical protein